MQGKHGQGGIMKIVINALLVTVFFFAFDTSSFAGSVKLTATISKPAGLLYGLPKTRQATPGQTGDDCDLKKGYPLSGPQYTVDNVNNTITDNGTGLMWINNTSLAGVSGTYSWPGAIAACTLTYAGCSNWRLPNIKELRSIVNYEMANPAIGESTSQSPWVNTDPGYYWSSTSHGWFTQMAWFVNFSDGSIMYAGYGLACRIRPVRGGG
jgi:hypothetical protein